MAMGYEKSMGRPSEPKAKYNSMKRDRNEETAPARNSAMVGKARRESLLEKRKAKKSSKPTGPIVI